MAERKGEGAVALWLGFAGLAGAFATAAAHVAIALTGWPRVVGIVAVAVLFPLTVGFAYLAFASHYERWPFRPTLAPRSRMYSMAEALRRADEDH